MKRRLAGLLALSAVPLLVGLARLISMSTGVSVFAARGKNFAAHEAWMTRAYALGAGAGTQVATMSLFSLPALESIRSTGSYAFFPRSARRSTRSLEVMS
jgi:hypothetical protein